MTPYSTLVRVPLAFTLVLASLFPALRAQTPLLIANNASAAAPPAPFATLPDAPAPAVLPEAPAPRRQRERVRMAPKYADLILSDERAQPLTGREKAILGFRDSIGPANLAGIVLSAAYSEVRNGEPNYGQNSAAFGQRVGASFVRDFSQEYFTDAVFAPLLHQDPRQYIEGTNRGVLHRIVYGATRPLITRNDDGKDTFNSSLLLGYAASTALTYAYYPGINRNFHDGAATFGGAIGGAALGDVIDEFAGHLLHRRRQ